MSEVKDGKSDIDKDYIITALCEVARRCSICYNIQNGSECIPCKDYYGECTCKPLTPEEIVDGVDDL